MRLKRLDIKGFKSFANETTIHFNEDVIGIVGPNGSGKSNIVDAIRWVLGEQKSRELRLDKMNSVIFNGSKKRRPAQMASVALTFDNTKNILPTEYNQVTIKRILYASGESEYRLNDVTCRLKDITNLFLDTGIGSNSYAIIALNMVEDLLADKENARRNMLEQAAGISKFKARKHETIQKLDSATADLARVEDLLFEINSNMTQLEKQAKRTQRFFEIREEYKQAGIRLAALRTAAFKEQLNELEQEVQQHDDAIRSLTAQLNAAEAELEKIRSQHTQREQLLSERQQTLNRLVGKMRQLDNDRQLLNQRQMFVKQNIEQAHSILAMSENRRQILERDIRSFQQSLSSEQDIEQNLTAQLSHTATQLEIVRQRHSHFKADLDQFLQQNQSFERHIFELEKQKAINASQAENARAEWAQHHDHIQSQSAEVTEIQNLVAQLEADIKSKSDTLSQLEKEEAERRSRLAQLEPVLDRLQKVIADKSRVLDALRNEHKLTKSMVESLEGFAESVKFLSGNAKWSDKPVLLSDLIYCQPEYRAAIEYYLEPWLSYFVTDTRSEAMEALTLLKQAQKGKAGFLVLEQIPTPDTPPEIVSFATNALELVEVEPKLQHLIRHLLGRVYIITHDLIQPPVEQYPHLEFITADGSVIQSAHRLAGGSVGLFEGKKIGRKKNIEVLERQMAERESELSKLQAEHQNTRQMMAQLREADKSGLIKQAQQAGQLAQQNLVVAQTRLENHNRRRAELDTRLSDISRLIADKQHANSQIDQELELTRQQLLDLQNQMAAADSGYKTVADELSTINTLYNEQNIAVIRQQNKRAAIERELRFRLDQLQELATESEKQKTQHAARSAELSDIEQQLAANSEQTQALALQRREADRLLNEAEQIYYEGRKKINELEDNIRRTNRQLTDKQSAATQSRDKLNAVKLSLTAVSERVQVEFNLTTDDILQQPLPTDTDIATLEQQAVRLKQRLDGYGDINPMAVEAYNEMQERYNMIATQRDDVLQAKTSLEATIREIEETATRQFLESFETIRANFVRVFRSLFSDEDSCDIVLVQPDRPLESPINIIARPKGKKPQSISQLSGGEKTLTATALLFALYLFKPAPFCIFDEVDAPLDDVNIEKFNKIIKNFSQESQFIIVTHNKLTMAAVDVIYGVHMPEPGVSAVTPVDFRSIRHDTTFETLSN